MRRQGWLALLLMLAGVVVALWGMPLTLRSGETSIAIAPGRFLHDAYVSIPAGVPAAGLFVVGVLLWLFRPGRKDDER